MTKQTARTAWHAMKPEQVLTEMKTDAHGGLTEHAARSRLEKYGYNEMKTEEMISPFALFFNQFTNILIIILLIATILSALVGEIFDAVLILVIVVFCAILGFIQEYRAERALEALKKMLSPSITVLRGGKEEEVPSKELVPGDVLLLEAGDKIPADARLIEGHSLRCDEAPLTGESVPVGKVVKSLSENVRVSDRRNIVFTGTIIIYGRGKVVVTSTGMATEFGKIAEEVTAVKTEKTPLEIRTEEIGKWLGIISLIICFLVAGIRVVKEIVGGKIDFPLLFTLGVFAFLPGAG